MEKEDVLKRWMGFGFLEGLNNEIAAEVADKFESLAKHLMMTSGLYSESVDIIAFPCVRLAYNHYGGLNDIYTPRNLCEKITEELKLLTDEDFEIDYEAKVCKNVAEFFGKPTF